MTMANTMNALSTIAGSGLAAAQLRLDVAANNVANAATPGYRRQALMQEAQAGGGVVSQVGQAGSDTENLAEDVVQQMVAAYSFKANLRVIETQDRLVGALLDVTA